MVARVGREYQGDIAVDDITFLNGTCDGKALNYQPRLKTLSLQKQQKGEPGTFSPSSCVSRSYVN